ncbi:MAG: hypothetical protein C5B49_13615 [Bdellovibrio sp.]|nr:MAG: hypothetical protein C5B49_13615 [Bdellovibrio sp.]
MLPSQLDVFFPLLVFFYGICGLFMMRFEVSPILRFSRPWLWFFVGFGSLWSLQNFFFHR